MKPIFLSLLFLLIGFLGGTLFGWKLENFGRSNYIVMQDINLESAYFFNSTKNSPISGILHKDSILSVAPIRKGDALYVNIPFVLKASETTIDPVHR